MDYVDILKEVNKNEDWEYDENNRINNFLYHRLFDGRDRLKYDCDAYYYKKIGYSNLDALHADTMVSFWMPYKSRLDKIGLNIQISDKDAIRKLINLDYKEKDDIMKLNNNSYIMRFAKIVYTKGNFMRLPLNKKFKQEGREMQGRGSFDFVCDEIDWTLKQCHNGGVYFKYFDYDESKVSEWIKREKLEVANSAFLSSNLYKLYQDMEDDEFYEYLDKVIELIEYRNEYYYPEEFMK